MPLRSNYKTLTDLWNKSAKKQLFAHKDEIDFDSGLDTCMYDNLLMCDSMEYDFDSARDLWLTKARFTVLQRDYLDLDKLVYFLGKCEEIGLGEAKRGVVTQMFCKWHGPSEKKYRWGNCMMAFTYRGGNKWEKPCLTLHSRVSYISYMGGLDLALAHVLAREIGNRIGLLPEDFKFRWMIDSLQYHGFKSIPYLFNKDYTEEAIYNRERWPDEEYPTLRTVRYWWDYMIRVKEEGKTLEEEKWGPVRRIRRRYEQHLGNDEPMIPVPIEELTFEPLYKRG